MRDTVVDHGVAVPVEDLAQAALIRLLRGMRIAALIVTAAIMLTASLWRKLSEHPHADLQIVAYGVLTAVLLIEVVLIVLRRPWGRWRVPAGGLVLAASATSGWSLATSQVTTSSDWAFGTVGWFGVILLLDRRIYELAGFLALHELVTVSRVLVTGPHELDFVINLLAGSIGTIGFPLAAGLGAASLRLIARRVVAAAEEERAIRTREAVAEGLHAHRSRRFGDVFATTKPLLAGLADGSLDPADARVQRACQIEAARMRRLFAESDLVADPLVHELEHCTRVADRRGVVVELLITGSWADPPLETRRTLTELPITVLSTARSWARVSVVGAAGVLSVNVVADSDVPEVTQQTTDDVAVRVLVEEEITWVEAQWPAAV